MASMDDKEEEQDKEEAEHPLFITSCPRDEDFENNHALGALAALIDETDDENKPTFCDEQDNSIQDSHIEEESKIIIENDRKPPQGKGNHQWKKINQRRDMKSSKTHRPQPYKLPSSSSSSTTNNNQSNGTNVVKRKRSTLGQAQICLALTTLN